jgi:site-specific DNA-methyltransferase (adenine-specific)
MNRALFSSANHAWETPDAVYDELNKEFAFDFDPCNKDSLWDGLIIDWGKSNFINPPYRNEIGKWLSKGLHESRKGRTCVFLIPSRTDTRWFHEYCMKADEIRFIKGRLKFKGAKYGAPFPSMIVVFLGIPKDKQGVLEL